MSEDCLVINVWTPAVSDGGKRAVMFRCHGGAFIAQLQHLNGNNRILVAINLDPTQEQAGWIDLDLKQLGIGHDEFFDVEDLLTGIHYQWHDRSNYVALRPDIMPAHIFRIVP